MTEGTQARTKRAAGIARKRSQDLSTARKRGPIYGADKAGTYLDVSRYTIYRLVERGELRAMKVNGKLRIAQSDLDEYIERAAS